MRRNRQAGFNLVELLIAVAILGIMVLSVLALFSVGTRNVYAGKQASKAVTLGTQVLEDLAPLNKQMIYQGEFGIATNATGNSFSLARASGLEAMSFTGSRIRSTNPTIVTGQSDISTSTRLLAKWTQRCSEAGLSDCSISVVLTPALQPLPPPNPAPALNFGNAQLLRVRVLVRWHEGNRPREAIWDTVKAY